jgi:hypothetical protein
VFPRETPLTRARPCRPAIVLAALGLLLVTGGCGLIGTAVNTAAKLAVPAAATKLTFACLPEGTPVDTPEGPVPIERLLPGEQVVGFDGAPVRILQVHAYAEDPAVGFLAVEFEDGARVTLCGMHRIDGVRARELAVGEEVAGRRIARIVRRHGVERSYDLLTEDAGYRIAGVPVNSMIEEMAAAARTGAYPVK